MEKILAVHNYYQQPGGEDRVFEAETALLERHGHVVIRYTRHNDDIRGMSALASAAATVWNRNTFRDFRRLLRTERPDVAHFHNTFPLISPAAYYACRAEGVPVVQTLHNYRLLCPNALFFRAGDVCEECLAKAFKWPAIRHACYRDSGVASATVASMLWTHRLIGTWRNKVDAYIALTRFSLRKFIEGGLDEARIAVKPNFVEDPGTGASTRSLKDGALFVGRLSGEKGVGLLLDAWRRIDTPLTVVGDGPLLAAARETAGASVRLVGPKERAFVLDAMRRSAFLVFPSECYENMSIVVLEALASGLPVIAARSGANPEIIQNGETGLLFDRRSVDDLRAKVRWAAENPRAMQRMGHQARRAYEASYTPDRNYALLAEIYRNAVTGWRRAPDATVHRLRETGISAPRDAKSPPRTS